ncbi:unnamed protein product [Mytilus coruscus]|uniref:Uncharacterized protein n=1 Tax=Mytilus coruscus TaxID=42192 RepID=A0A6J8ENU2_MYTCO|nr:unnamed protein product [Mytilus coruscus]
MSNTHRTPPKQWCLTKIETVNSFENLKQNIIYTLSLDPHFAPFLGGGVQLEKKTRKATNRGFLNDGEDVAEANRSTREQKVSIGATGNMLRASAGTRMGIEIKSSSQSAHQADGSSSLKVTGEVYTNFTRDGRELHFEGLVVETLYVDILAGIPFMEKKLHFYPPC